MHLALLEQALEGNTKALCKPRTIRVDRIVVVPEMKAEVQRIVWRFADPALACRERVPKTVPTEQS